MINRNIFNPATQAYEAPHHPDDFVPAPGAIQAVRRLRDAGYVLCVVSNQPDYALGKASLEALAAIHQRLETSLHQAGITLDAVYYCYHHPRGITPGYAGPCECRKPSPHFLLAAQKNFGIDMAASWMVGDRETDIVCGQAAGARTIRIQPDHPTANPLDTAADALADDLAQAVGIILARDHPPA